MTPYFRLIAFLTFIAVVYGFAAPALVSSRSDEGAVAGVALAVVAVPLAWLIATYKRDVPKPNRKNRSKK